MPRALTVPVVLALLAVAAPAHETDEADCIELVAENDRWHLANRCAYGVDMSWCPVEDGDCVWKGKHSLSPAGTAGDAHSTGYPVAESLNGHVVACRNDPPDYGGMWGTVDQGTGRYWCLDPRFEEVGRAAGETVPDDGHCVEFGPPYRDRYGHRNQLLGRFRELRNVCAYGVEFVMCYVPPNDQFTRSALCGGVGRYYPIGFDRHLQGSGRAGSGSRVHAEGVEWAACRHGFDPDGFDGSGGFRCLGDARGSTAPRSGGGGPGQGDAATGAADAPREPAASPGGVLTYDD